MVFIPIGLKSKIKNPPFLVGSIIVFTIYITLFSFSQIDEYHREFVDSEQRQKYFFELRKMYLNACDLFQDKKTCDLLVEFKIADFVRSPYAANSDAKRYLALAQNADKNIFYDWHSAEVMSKKFKEKNKTNELKAIQSLESESNQTLTEYQKKYNLLSQNHFTPYALLKAQFTHSDWWHLLGNLTFFLLFGACLEQAMGWRWLLGIYFIGGSLGLATQVLNIESTTFYVVGASANIFACAGAFLRLYWKQPLKILFSFLFFINKTVQLPTWSFFIFFVLIQQVSGLTLSDGAGVAYLAHLVGLAVGFGMAQLWILKTQFSPSQNLIFPYESEMLARVQARTGCKEKLNVLVDLLFYAPQNIKAYEKFYQTSKECTCDVHCMSEGSQKFYAQQISKTIKELLLENNTDIAAHMYSLAHELKCNIATLIQHFTADDVILFGNYLYHHKNKTLLAELFQAATQTFPQDQNYLFSQFLDSLNREVKDHDHAS